jgi:hypothetical protein
MRTQRLVAYAFAACLVSLMAGSAMADDERGNPNALLKGTYRHMASSNAASAGAAGFTSFPSLQALGDGSTGHVYFTGVITYDGNGHATEKLHGISLIDGPYAAGTYPVLTFEEDCDWTYAVNRDGSFSREGSCKGKDTGGQFAGSTYTLSGLTYEGQIAVGGGILITYQVEPVVTELSNGFSVKQIGGIQGTEVRIRGKHQDQE